MCVGTPLQYGDREAFSPAHAKPNNSSSIPPLGYVSNSRATNGIFDLFFFYVSCMTVSVDNVNSITRPITAPAALPSAKISIYDKLLHGQNVAVSVYTMKNDLS